MAERHGSARSHHRRPAIFDRFHDHAPTTAQIVGFLTLASSAGLLLLISGLTFAGLAAVLALLAPIALITSPIWFPAAAAVALGTAAVVGMCGVGAAATWVYRYSTGRHPVGSDRVDYARNRIADTASHVKDYAREYGGYLQSRVKDAAPGA